MFPSEKPQELKEVSENDGVSKLSIAERQKTLKNMVLTKPTDHKYFAGITATSKSNQAPYINHTAATPPPIEEHKPLLEDKYEDANTLCCCSLT